MPYEINIADPDTGFEATFVPEAGMIGNSLRHEGEELLYQGGGLEPYRKSAAMFGLPLLHPWANRLSAWAFQLGEQHIMLDPESPITQLDEPTGTPKHGLLAASSHWTVTDADRNTLTAELDFGRVPEYMAAFPLPHIVRYSASIEGTTLTIAFGVRATGDVDVPISFGFHPYLTLPGSDRRSWQVQVPVARQAMVDDRMLPTGETVELAPGELDGPLGERTFDTSYPVLHGEQPEFVVADERRRLTLKHIAGYPVSQVYAPEASQFICYEPMTAPVDALISGEGLRWAKPGQDFEAVFAISVTQA